MRPDIQTLQHYYASPAGRKIQMRLIDVLQPLLTRHKQARLLGLGYAAPFLNGLAESTERVVLAMQASQGAQRWPEAGGNCACLVEDKSLPFADSLFDQVLVVHALEFAGPARRMLRELWRVLAPGGTLVFIVPNRTSLLMLASKSPFSSGEPYTRQQLYTLLTDALFQPLAWQTALTLPSLPGGHAVDSVLSQSGLGGVHIVKAGKQVGAIPKPMVRAGGRRIMVATGASA